MANEVTAAAESRTSQRRSPTRKTASQHNPADMYTANSPSPSTTRFRASPRRVRLATTTTIKSSHIAHTSPERSVWRALNRTSPPPVHSPLVDA
jgi:hypothetical protein